MEILSTYLARWLEKKKGTVTLLVANNMVRQVACWAEVIGGLEPRELGPEQVEKIERRASEGKSGAWANMHRTNFKQFVRYLLDLEVIQRDPTRGWKRRVEVKQRRTVKLTPEDIERLAAVGEAWLGRFVRFAYATGLREGTIRSLKWENVGEDGTLRVEGRQIKTRRALNVPLSEEALKALGVRGEGLLFEGLPDAQRVYVAFKAAVRKAGVDSAAKVHDLRASFAMRLLERGASTLLVMQLGGWASAETVAKHYYVPVSREQAVKYLD